MQKLAKAEVEKLAYAVSKTRTIHPVVDQVYSNLSSLLVGEGVLVSRAEWPHKNTPSHSQIPKRYFPVPFAKFSTKKLLDQSGFVITRVE